MIVRGLIIDRQDPEDLRIDETTDFPALAGRLASATQEIWPSTDPRFDPDPEPLIRVFRELLGSVWADRLSEAVAGCLNHPEPYEQFVVLWFFREFPGAPGSHQILDAIEGSNGTPKPWNPGRSPGSPDFSPEDQALFRERLEFFRRHWEGPELAALASRIRTASKKKGTG